MKRMHKHLEELYGKTESEARAICGECDYKLVVIADGEEMNHDGLTVSVRLNEANLIKDVFAWARPILRAGDGQHPDAWNDSWLDEKNSAILSAFIARVMDPNDPTGKRIRHTPKTQGASNG